MKESNKRWGEGTGIRATLAELMELRHAVQAAALLPGRSPRSSRAGVHASAFRGRGIEFDEVRAYQAGDDARSIDWRVTARRGRVHTKLYHEDRERPVWLLVDVSPGMHFGTRRAFKSVVAARVAALLAWSARRAGDRVGGLVVSSESLREVAPRSGDSQVMGLLAAVARATTAEGDEPAAALSVCLERLRHRARAGSRVFVVSDFVDLDDSGREHLAELARHCDVTCLSVYDALEAEAPLPGHYRVTDGHEIHAFHSGAEEWQRAYAEPFERRSRERTSFCRRHRIEHVSLRTDEDPVQLLVGAFAISADRARSAA